MLNVLEIKKVENWYFLDIKMILSRFTMYIFIKAKQKVSRASDNNSGKIKIKIIKMNIIECNRIVPQTQHTTPTQTSSRNTQKRSESFNGAADYQKKNEQRILTERQKSVFFSVSFQNQNSNLISETRK